MSGKNEKKRPLVPRLRFPEFREAGEWERKRLESIADFFKGKGISKADIDANGKTPCIRYGELYTTYREIIDLVFLKTNCPSSDLVFSRKNDIIIPASGETKLDIATASCVMLDGVALGGDLNIIRSNQNGIFISYYLNSSKKTEIAKIAQGDTIVHLYINQLKLIDIAIPKKNEQQKIAAFLSSIDERITVEINKLNALKSHKKGLLRQLFPVEGKTVPQLRFPEFRNAGEWENKKLGMLANVAMCKRIFSEQTNGKSGVPFFKIGTLGRTPDAFISKNIFEEYKKKYPFPKNGEILITCSGTIGNLLVYNGEDAYFQDSNIVWIENEKHELENSLLYYLLLSVDWKTLNTTTITRIYGDDLRNLKLNFPPNHQEQQKIADCLSSLDDLIAVQRQKIDLLKRHKKGLMQQLFPSTNEAKA